MPTLDFWHWWVAALVLLILEMLLPGFFLLWLGVAAATVGLLLFVWPGMPFELQLLVFAVASVASIFGWRAWRTRHPEPNDQPHLNERAHRYVGRVFTLDAPVVNGVGKIRVDDSTWKINGPDLPAGTGVRVTGVDGTVLLVEPA